ncbi:MAG: hypothetical protein ABR521_01920 [Gaiellaceae bacterium]
MTPAPRTPEREGYQSALAGLWGDLARTLHALEAVATAPGEHLADEQVLPALQYSLHRTGELVLGLEPPPGAESAHTELAEALVDARDATAEVAAAVAAGGPAAAWPLVHEWRGALFRVRLARMRLNSRPVQTVPRPVPSAPAYDRAALASTLLVLAGTLVVAWGAVVGIWQLWVAGLVLVAGAVVAYRP